MNPPAEAKPPRLLSLDALRGFDMLWIIGGETVIHQLARWQQSPALEAASRQLRHVPWEGLHAYDLIFPLFMFLSGIAIPLSMDGRLDRGDSKGRLWRKILTRTLLLILLGLFYNGVFSGSTHEPRFPSVLGQIGIAWGIAASLHLLIRKTGTRIIILCGLLAGIAALQLLVPVPGHGAGELTRTGAINAWLDRTLLPGRLHGGTFDPEGLLCILSASALTIAGALTGSRLRMPGGISWKTAGLQTLAGLALIGAGWLCWHLGYPPVKALWTTTFNLLAIGISLLLFATFFSIIDLLRFHHWSFPLRVIGMNPLTIYLLARMVSFQASGDLLFGRLARHAGDAAPVVLACGMLLIEWALLWFFHRKKWFLRV